MDRSVQQPNAPPQSPAVSDPASPFESDASLTPAGRIDELVFGRLKRLGIQPARLCSDGVFVRRAFFDVIGTIPTEKEVRDFLADRSPGKRRALIDSLLARDEFADYWAFKWGDLLRIKSEFPVDLWPDAVQAYHRWVRTAVATDMPYDRFARELLTSSGSNFRTPQVNFYRAVPARQPDVLARAVALTFMGMRAENWAPKRLAGLTAFFTHLVYKHTGEWKEDIVMVDPLATPKRIPGVVFGPAAFPDGTPAHLSADRDPRDVLADWLITPKNPWFTKNIVNRVWFWLMGRGIVQEPDDIRPDNPPSNPELLAYLESQLVAAHYDLKQLYRCILTSKTYQLSSIPRSTRPTAEANFAHYIPRRLEAEVLCDAINQITGTSEEYSSPIPEPFTFIPSNQRAIALADGSISSSFLAMFGRSPRDTGLEMERNNRSTPAQSLHLLNSSHIRTKLDRGPNMLALLQTQSAPTKLAEDLYLTILSRVPTDAELQVITDHARRDKLSRRDMASDLAWALINSAEFLYRH